MTIPKIMPNTSRNISVELLRVLFMLSIVSMHSIIYREGGAGLLPSDGGDWMSCMRYGLLGLCHIGVSGFLFISGYYGIRLKWYKLWNIWTQALLYSVIIAILGLWIWNVPFVKYALHFCMPISRSEWFVMDYVVLMLLSPFIEPGIERISKQQFLGIIGFLSVMLYIGRFGSFDKGTSFLLMLDIYLIGRYIRHYPLNWSNARVRMIMMGSLVTLFVLPFGFAMMSAPKLLKLVLSNYNIFALLAAGSMVVLADRKPIYTQYSISLGSNVLAVFLITESPIIREYLWKGAFASEPLLVRISIIFASLFFCMIIDQCRQWILVPLTNNIYRKCVKIRNNYNSKKNIL